MGGQPTPAARPRPGGASGPEAATSPRPASLVPIQPSDSGTGQDGQTGQVAQLRKLLAEPDGRTPRARGRSLAAVAAAAILGPLPQTDLAPLAGVSPPTVSSLLPELVDLGLVTVRRDTGSRFHSVHAAQMPAAVVGVEVDHPRVRVVARRLGGDQPHHRSCVVPAWSVDWVGPTTDLIDDLLDHLRLDRSDILTCGLALPGPVEVGTGAVQTDTDGPWRPGDRPGQQLATALGTTVTVDQRAGLAAFAEHLHRPATVPANAVYVYAGERTEAGILLSGQIMRGTHGSAGQLGHLPVLAEGIGSNLLCCDCGAEGLLQAVLHPQRLLEEFGTAKSHYRPTPHLGTVQDLATAARAGDPAAAGVLTDAGRVLGTAIATIALVLYPPLVLLGGELADAGELVLAPAQAVVDAHRPQRRDGTAALELGALGEHAAATGALAAGVLGGVCRDGEREKVR